MRRIPFMICLLLFVFSVSAAPYVSASSNLVESGVTQSFKSEITFTKVLDDGTVLIVEQNGYISSNTLSAGVLTQLWNVETGNSANYAKLDSGEKFLAIIHETGFLTFDIENQIIDDNVTLANVPDSLDWDSDGDIWVAYHSGIRKAKEYRNGAYNNAQTSVVSSGFFSFEVTEDNQLVMGGFDSKLHIFDQQGNLVTQKTEPTTYMSKLDDLGNGIIIGGSGDGKLHLYNYTNSWEHSYIQISSNQITSLGNFNDTTYFAIDGDDQIYIIDLTTTTISDTISSDFGSNYVIGELSGTVSVIKNSGGIAEILYFDLDSDGDGVSNTLDAFPYDSTQQYDTDEDGYGDNNDGLNGDAFPNNPEQYADSDNDGFGDNQFGTGGDLFPDNSEQWSDSDGDGFGDNSSGYLGDQFIDDSTQWNDTDGDGYGDNQAGNSPDACPNTAGYSNIDRFGCIDTDFDYYSNPSEGYGVEDGADALPDDKTQWEDFDGDGYGDNQDGNSPDACPSVFGNSTMEIRVDGTTIEKLGCLDSDGDSYDDLSDDLHLDPTEWFDYDEDGIGSNSDYDDNDKSIATKEDYCNITGDTSATCAEFNNLEYQDYLGRDKADGESDLSYSAWLAQKEAGLFDEDEGLMDAIIDVAVVGGGVFIIATILILLASFVMKKRKINDLVKRYGVPFEPKESNTANQEALEGTAGLSATGGVESDDSWDDDVDTMDFSDKLDEVDEVEPTIVSADELYSDDNNLSELAGIEVDDTEANGENLSEVLADEQEATEEKPSVAPPVPESGLPEGWTMEQWEWYGHEWIAKYGGK